MKEIKRQGEERERDINLNDLKRIHKKQLLPIKSHLASQAASQQARSHQQRTLKQIPFKKDSRTTL